MESGQHSWHFWFAFSFTYLVSNTVTLQTHFSDYVAKYKQIEGILHSYISNPEAFIQLNCYITIAGTNMTT